MAKTDNAETETVEAEEPSALPKAAHDLVNHHAAYAAVGGLIPVPLVEVIASGTIQLRMIAKLCDLYGLPFSEQAVKASIATLVGTLAPVGVLGRTTFSLFRSVPVVGSLLGMVTLPVLAGAVTWALGRVFAWHFAQGGTLENFDASAKKEQFKREFQEGRRRAAQFVRGNGGKTGGGEAEPAKA